MTSYDLGDDVILTLVFTVDNVLTDPTAAACKVRQPDDSEVTVSLTKKSTGVYEGTFTPAQPGEHWYRGSGTGAAKAAGEDVFVVKQPHVP